MTAYELIQELLNYPADTPVFVMLSDELDVGEASQVRLVEKPRYGNPPRLEIRV